MTKCPKCGPKLEKVIPSCEKSGFDMEEEIRRKLKEKSEEMHKAVDEAIKRGGPVFSPRRGRDLW